MTFAELAFHQLTSRRNPEAYLWTCVSANDPKWVEGMLEALAFVRNMASAQAAATGEPTRVCTCCDALRTVTSFRRRIDRRFPGRVFTVAACLECERGYCRI